jgi:GT2 family glycosyltransferase
MERSDTDGVSRIALAVVTRNRSGFLERYVLESLRHAPRRDVEVVLVDQSDDEATARLVSDIPGLRYMRSGPGLSYGRNVAVAATRTPLIAFTDDDVTFRDGWLETIVDLFEETPEAGAVCGRGRDEHGNERPGGRPGKYSWPANPFDLGGGFNLSFRRAALADAGPFDANLGAGTALRAGEDTDMLYRVLRAGWSVVCSDRITVIHHDWRSPSDKPRLYYGYGLGAGAQTAKHVRVGDRRALLLTLRESARHLVTLARSIVTRRPRVAQVQLWWYAGLLAGFLRYPRSGRVDRPRPRPRRRDLEA